jgi:hypothetical protein
MMNRLLITCALLGGCNATTATPESDANQGELTAIRAELELLKATHAEDLRVLAEQDRQILVEVQTQITPLAAAVERNTEKVGISAEQADAIIANSAKAGVSAEQAEAILTNTAKVGLSETQTETLNNAIRIANQTTLGVGNSQNFRMPTQPPITTATVSVPAAGRYLVFMNAMFTGPSLCHLLLNNIPMATYSDENVYSGETLITLEADDQIFLICAGNDDETWHRSSYLLAVPVL